MYLSDDRCERTDMTAKCKIVVTVTWHFMSIRIMYRSIGQFQISRNSQFTDFQKFLISVKCRNLEVHIFKYADFWKFQMSGIPWFLDISIHNACDVRRQKYLNLSTIFVKFPKIGKMELWIKWNFIVVTELCYGTCIHTHACVYIHAYIHVSMYIILIFFIQNIQIQNTEFREFDISEFHK